MLFLAVSCSTKRNTGLSRTYHGMTARYNIFFNGDEAFEKGVKRIEDALVDDYTQILPLFYYSVHENLGKSNSDMDRTIEKSKKLIKKHSIRSRPKFKSSRAGDEKYLEWYRREEFNVMVDDAYLLMGKAHFFKGDFLESIGVFNYIRRHFSTQFVRYEAEIWMARAYAEMGWFYEAENILKAANDDNFPFQLKGEFAAINADIYLKQGMYRDAIPFLKDAIEEQKDRKLKRRFMYILAQLYHEADNYENALATYQDVLRMNPPYEMEFNARIKLTEVFQGEGNSEGIKKELKKMIKDEKNKEYLDQIYYALANLDLNDNNPDQAIENYLLSVESSTSNAIQKGLSHLALANIYFGQRNYREAQPHYAGAANAFGDDYPGARQIKNLAGVLNQMAEHYEIIAYEDSMQMVAMLSPADQNELIDGIIQSLIDEEKKMAEGLESGNSMLSLAEQSDWYFYNQNLVQRGRDEFKRLWGNRKLEDNWRMSQKMSTGFGNMAQTEQTDGEEETVEDTKTREYYLKNIPSSEEDFKASDNRKAVATFSLGDIFRTNLEDYNQAIENYTLVAEKHPKHEKVLESYFGLYQAYGKLGNSAEESRYKNLIISEFPNSRYATILSDPNYIEKLAIAEAEQDSLYEASYKAYMKGEFDEVIYNYKVVSERYPDTKLMPNFMFLNALITGVNDSVDVFRKQLETLKTNYPNERVSKQAANILAQLDAGKEPSGSTSTVGSLLAKRNELLEQLGMEQFEDTTLTSGGDARGSLFTFDKEALHYFVMLIPTGGVDENQFLYEVARFNFTKFLVKDFDLSWVSYNTDTTIMIINGFNGLDEGLWYQRTFILDESLYELLKTIPYERLVISDRNFRALVTTRNLAAYKRFYNVNIKKLEGTIKDPQENNDTSYNEPPDDALLLHDVNKKTQ